MSGLFKQIGQLWRKAQTVVPASLTDGATINTDASLSNTYRVTLGGNRILANPTNLVDGQDIMWIFTQDGTGGRLLTYGTMFKFFDGGVPPTLSTLAGGKDVLAGIYDGSDNTIMCGFRRGAA
jgi:hypothetical protein